MSMLCDFGASRQWSLQGYFFTIMRQDPPLVIILQCLLNCEVYCSCGNDTISGSVCLTLFPLILYAPHPHIIYTFHYDSHFSVIRFTENHPLILSVSVCPASSHHLGLSGFSGCFLNSKDLLCLPGFSVLQLRNYAR